MSPLRRAPPPARRPSGRKRRRHVHRPAGVGQGRVEVIASRSIGTTYVPPACASKPYARDAPSALLALADGVPAPGNPRGRGQKHPREARPRVSRRAPAPGRTDVRAGVPAVRKGEERCGCVPSSAPHALRHTALSALGTSHASSGTPPGSPLTVHRRTTSPRCPPPRRRMGRAPTAEVRGLRTGEELVLGAARDSHASREKRERERRPESPHATCHVR